MSKIVLGMSLKMYFSRERTLDWCHKVTALVKDHPAVKMGKVELFLLPSFPLIIPAKDALEGSSIRVGAQDIHWEDNGAYTGEVSPALIAEIGGRYAEIGHAERRYLFGETEKNIALKTAAALRNGLTPVLCIGEKERGSAEFAVAACVEQVKQALSDTHHEGEVILAYEPVWAIGASEAASADHVRDVCSQLRTEVSNAFSHHFSIIYGGSAGPGLLTKLLGSVDGLFLGRFAHDPNAFADILDEVPLD